MLSMQRKEEQRLILGHRTGLCDTPERARASPYSVQFLQSTVVLSSQKVGITTFCRGSGLCTHMWEAFLKRWFNGPILSKSQPPDPNRQIGKVCWPDLPFVHAVRF